MINIEPKFKALMGWLAIVSIVVLLSSCFPKPVAKEPLAELQQLLPTRLRSTGLLGAFEVIIHNDSAWDSLLSEMTKFDLHIDYDRIKKYCEEHWGDVLKRAGLLSNDPMRPKLRAELKLSRGNWYTVQILGPVAGRKISQGVYVESALYITTSRSDAIILEFSGGYSFINNATQWENLTRSTDIPLGFLLAAYARAGVSTPSCVALLPETLSGDDLEKALFEIGRVRGAGSIVPVFKRNECFTNEAATHVLIKLGDTSAIEPLKALLNDSGIDWITREEIQELLGTLTSSRKGNSF